MVVLSKCFFLKNIKHLNFVLSYSFDNSGNLLDLVLRGELDEAKRLIENGADVRAEDQHGKKKKMKKITILSLQMIMNYLLEIFCWNFR